MGLLQSHQFWRAIPPRCQEVSPGSSGCSACGFLVRRFSAPDVAVQGVAKFRDQRARTGPIVRTLEDQVRWTINPEVPAYTAALILDESSPRPYRSQRRAKASAASKPQTPQPERKRRANSRFLHTQARPDGWRTWSAPTRDDACGHAPEPQPGTHGWKANPRIRCCGRFLEAGRPGADRLVSPDIRHAS